MKKSIFTIFCALLSSTALWAQPDTLTVNERVQANLTATDIRAIVDLDTTGTILPSFVPDTNANWDLSNVVYQGTRRAPRYAAIAPYHFSDSIGIEIGPLRYMARGANLYVISGVEQDKRYIDTQTVSITKPSGLMDTLAFTFQTIQYNGSYSKIPYPLTYTIPTRTWSSSYSYATAFNVSDRELGLFKGKATIYSRHTETDSVVGWGKMQLQTNQYDSTAMEWKEANLNVLQVRTAHNRVDSVVLPNATGIYDSLGFDTVYNHTVYTTNFYNMAGLLPLVKVTYYDASYDSIIAVEVGVSDASPVGVSEVSSKVSNIKVYPNPVTNGKIFIEVPNASGKWSYQLINIAGQQIQAGALVLGNGQNNAQISLTNKLVPGVYYVRLMNNNATADVHAVVIQ